MYCAQQTSDKRHNVGYDVQKSVLPKSGGASNNNRKFTFD